MLIQTRRVFAETVTFMNHRVILYHIWFSKGYKMFIDIMCMIVLFIECPVTIHPQPRVQTAVAVLCSTPLVS